MKAPWWTEADAAELGVLVDELVGAALDHRRRCSVCKTGGPWCGPLRDCYEITIAWRNTRSRQSKAEWLRALRGQLTATTKEVGA